MSHLTRNTAVFAFGAMLVLAGCGANDAGAHRPPVRHRVDGTPLPRTTASSTGRRDIRSTPRPRRLGYRTDMPVVHARQFAVATANPLATQAACRILDDGGARRRRDRRRPGGPRTRRTSILPASAGGFLVYDAASGSRRGRTTATGSHRPGRRRTTSMVSDTDRSGRSPMRARRDGRSGCRGSCGCSPTCTPRGKTAWRAISSIPRYRLPIKAFRSAPTGGRRHRRRAPGWHGTSMRPNTFLNADAGRSGLTKSSPIRRMRKTLGAIASRSVGVLFRVPSRPTSSKPCRHLRPDTRRHVDRRFDELPRGQT